MIGFLSPWFLLGLAAVAVPVALHLLHRRRVPVVPFPLVHLLERVERSRAPRRRLNRVLLLLARALFLAVLALALARTVLGPGSIALAASGPLALVVIVDDSLSASARSASGRSVFEESLAAADAALAALPEGSLAAVLASSDPGTGERAGFLADADEARRAVQALQPTFRRVTLGPALVAAARLLAAASLPERRVLLVSDTARHAFEGLDLPAQDAPRPSLVALAPERSGTGANRAVTGLEVQSLPDGRARVAVRASAWGLAAGGGEDVTFEVQAGAMGAPPRLAGRGVLKPGSGASSERLLDLVLPEQGAARVIAQLAQDELPADDAREAAYHAASRLRALVVDGDPQNISLGSETFYLEQALAPGVGLDFDAQIVSLAQVDDTALGGRDVVVLCNVPELSSERLAALETAVRAGTALVVALGDRVDQRAWNGRLAGLLPALLGGPVVPSPPTAVERSGGLLDLPRVAVRQHFVLEPSEGATVLVRLADGAPLAVKGRLGEGSVVLLAIPLDRDWTDLPISPHYLAFVRGLLEQAIGRREGLVLPEVTVGTPVDLAQALSGEDALTATVSGPDGTRHALSGVTTFAATDAPGVHAVEAGGNLVATFAVVVDPAESDLSRVSAEELRGLVAPAFDAPAPGESGGSGGGFPLWKACLLGVVLLAIAEAALARKAA